MSLIRKSSIWDDRCCVCLFGRRFIFEKVGRRWRYVGWYRP